MKKEEYIYKINLIGKEAYSLGYSDIYQIAFLYKKFKSNTFIKKHIYIFILKNGR